MTNFLITEEVVAQDGLNPPVTYVSFTAKEYKYHLQDAFVMGMAVATLIFVAVYVVFFVLR